MPDQTPTWQLPYPLVGDPPAGHLQIQALADRLETILTDLQGAREAPGAALASRSNAMDDVTTGGAIGDATGWLVQQSFSVQTAPAVPDSGDVKIVVIATGTCKWNNPSADRRQGRVRVEFDPPGSGAWQQSDGNPAVQTVELRGADQRATAVAVTGAVEVPVAQALTCRWRVVVSQPNLGSPGDLQFTDGRATAWMTRAG